ncbi:MAG: hypothetical protein EXS09_14620 [Gemmataceae bacterium]|nr:hypothetical protein [Gemmataceae bacterium]
MAKCDEGYICDVCGQDVEAIVDSDLYLRYVLGDVQLDFLHRLRERHIRCNPALAQYIVDERFPPVSHPGDFDKANMDAEFVREEEERVTQGWRRLQAIPTLGLSVAEYPLSVTPE